MHGIFRKQKTQMSHLFGFGLALLIIKWTLALRASLRCPSLLSCRPVRRLPHGKSRQQGLPPFVDLPFVVQYRRDCRLRRDSLFATTSLQLGLFQTPVRRLPFVIVSSLAPSCPALICPPLN
jgi:hypothetical protein